jgi:circadian clock protein KaiC
MNQNLIIVVRVAPPSDLYEAGNPDEFLVEYMNDIVTVVDQYQPNKIVFDELTPFIGFNNLNLLQDVFMRTTESIEDNGITSLFILGEPATSLAELIVDALAAYSTGIIYLKKKEGEVGSQSGGIMTITPNIGHTEGQFKANYSIEPYKGITVEFKETRARTQTGPSTFSVTNTSDKESKYKSLADINVPEENISIPNYYSINDFYLILNNQIALYKSTGQIFTIISFKLDQAAEKSGLLTITQLQNAIRLSTDKKDKLCVLSNKVVILITKEDPKIVVSLISKVKSNLPNNDPDYIKNVTQYISVYALRVDQSVQTADDIFHQLTSDEHQEKNEPGFY